MLCSYFASVIIEGQNYNVEDQILNKLNYGVVDAINAENVVLVIQSGNRNELILNQFSQEQLAIIQQVGMDNLIKAIQKGDINLLEILQAGDRNSNETLLREKNISTSVHQFGKIPHCNKSLLGIIRALKLLRLEMTTN